MSSSITQDVSLYELALQSEESPAPLQVSPATLKSIVSSAIDVLIEQKLPATLWIKLPRDDVWQAEIKRYCESAQVPHTLYLFRTSKDEVLSATSAIANGQGEAYPNQDLLRNAEEAVDFSAVSHSSSALVTLQLAAESQLKREYFLFFLSPQFSGLVLAHRPRSLRPTKSETATPTNAPKGGTAEKATTEEEGLEKKQPLLACCSFNPTTLQQVFSGIKQAVTVTQTLHSESAIAASHLVGSWDQLLQQGLAQPVDSNLFSRFLTKQVQRQEEVWHRSTIYRKQAESAETLQVQNEELLNALRLKDEFLSTVGQELRTPLTNMKTALTLLNSPSLKPAQRQRYMQVLSTECDRQGSLIASLLDLVQLDREIENSTMQPVSLAEIVPGVVSTYQPLAQEKGIMLAYTVPEELPLVSCLSAWLKQIVINLLHNGIKFTPKSGQVWVRAKQQGDYVQLEFRDTGIGIPTSEIPKIFDRFYRARHVAGEDPGGAGLGLTIVQQILLRCGGSVSVKSKLSEGSTFNVLLPIYRAPMEGGKMRDEG
ncbi:ATP-binding protein [Trichocoleus desertorum AS-A10]|uniref:DICT sensory domain-containing protein n=1 Tax=Trichocoleus desertorum TaxID=1481672 RepID=UPI0032995AA4